MNTHRLPRLLLVISILLSTLLSLARLRAQVYTDGDANPAITTSVSSFSQNIVIQLGNTATGSLNIEDGGAISVSGLRAGISGSGNGLVSMTGGILTVSGDAVIASSVTGALCISGGTANFNTLVFGKYYSGSATASITGGVVTASSVLAGDMGTCSFAVSNAVLHTTTLSVGEFGYGTMSVSSSIITANVAKIAAIWGVSLMSLESGTASFGTLVVGSENPGLIRFGYDGSGSLNISGGVLTVSGATRVASRGYGSIRMSAGEAHFGDIYMCSVSRVAYEETEGGLYIPVEEHDGTMSNGVASIVVNGGTFSSVGVTQVGQFGTGTLSITSGTASFATLSVGAGTGSCSGSLEVSNAAQFAVAHDLTVGDYGRMRLTVVGAASGDTLVGSVGGVLSLSDSGGYVIDLSGLTTEISLSDPMDVFYTSALGAGATDAQWVIEGYAFATPEGYTLAAFWDDTTLQVGLVAIPEPAWCAALLGLVGLALAARRRGA